MSDLDLKPFCGTEAARPYLHQPFSAGEYTYATNGHIIVRVARRPGAQPLDNDIKFDPKKPFADRDKLKFAPPSAYVMPSVDMAEATCPACDGRGHEHNCDDCTCTCEDCGGTGKVAQVVSTTVNGVPFDLRYIRMTLALPGIELATGFSGKRMPLHFNFEDGIGAIMPMRDCYSNHVEIFANAEAAE